MALTKKQAKDVCMAWTGYQQCRYLDEDISDEGDLVYVCKKKSAYKSIIDDEVDDFLLDMKNTGQDPAAQGLPIGDNCGGYVVLKSKEQGYDVP